jgi:hypothetical protein
MRQREATLAATKSKKSLLSAAAPLALRGDAPEGKFRGSITMVSCETGARGPSESTEGLSGRQRPGGLGAAAARIFLFRQFYRTKPCDGSHSAMNKLRGIHLQRKPGIRTSGKPPRASESAALGRDLFRVGPYPASIRSSTAYNPWFPYQTGAAVAAREPPPGLRPAEGRAPSEQ